MSKVTNDLFSTGAYEPLLAGSKTQTHSKSLSDMLQKIFTTKKSILPSEEEVRRDPIDNTFLILHTFQRIHAKEKSSRFKASSELTSELIDRYIEAGAKVGATDSCGHTALHYAAKIGRSDLVKALLTAGANIDAQGVVGYTPLHLAAYEGHDSTTKLLLEEGANADLISECPQDFGEHKNCLPLHFACGLGQEATARHLIMRTSNIDAITSLGWNALHFAARSGSTQIAQLLLATKKFDVLTMTGDHKTVLAIAKEHGKASFSSFITPYYLEVQ